MKLQDIMTSDVEVVRPDATVRQAARLMKELDVGTIPICDGERLVGMITDRDITVRGTADGRDPEQTRVHDVMSGDLVYCFEDQDVEEASRLMSGRQIRRLPILNRQKRLVGIVSLGDLAVRSDGGAAGRTLEDVSQPAR